MEFGIMDVKTGLCVNFGLVQGDCEAESWHSRDSKSAGRFSANELEVFLKDLASYGYTVEQFAW